MGIISVSNKNRERMETERNLLYKVSVKLFVVHRKDANTGCLKNHKLESGISDGGVEGKSMVINKP